jgi:acyl-coenzyme A thioesterase PaaI-like protein
MTDPEHYRKLERLYAAAPITQWYGATIAITEGAAEVRIPTRPEFYHAAHAVHGSVARPVTGGELLAVGRVLHRMGRLFLAESELLDEQGHLLGCGSGVFTRSGIPLDPTIGYAL